MLQGYSKVYCEYGTATGVLCSVYDDLGELYPASLSGLMGSEADSCTCNLNFDIVNPLSKGKEAETEDRNLFFRWLGVLYLLAVVVDGMEQSLV